MDPATGLGLASSLITCVEFSARIISATKVIFSSDDGLSIDDMKVEEVYTKLSTLSKRLNKVPLPISRSPQDLSLDFGPLEELSHACEKDCQVILSIINDLEVHQGPNQPWKSVKASFKDVIGSKSIGDIESRLAQSQRVISLQFASLLSYNTAELFEKVDNLRSEDHRLKCQQMHALEAVTVKLDNLKIEADRIQTAVDAQSESLDANKLADTTTVGGIHVEHIISLLNQLLGLVREQRHMSRIHGILKTLDFNSRPVRHDAIPEAHHSTFKWIFDTSFSDWVRVGKGVFWVMGKPGSGKSTLMKFMSDHATTRKLLESRPRCRPAVIASHYFCSAGTPMQKSLRGLLQSLLFAVFRAQPSIIPVVCPSRWTALEDDQSPPSTDWTVAELYQAMISIALHQDLGVDFFFFIDGLDEYEGDHQELCLSLKEISKSPTVKLCVSSRPWPVFEDSFGVNTCNRLCVHDLTMDDILTFSKDELSKYPWWSTSTLDTEDKKSLVEDISARAKGNFLWVVLVIRSLRDGLANDDTVELIRRRLHRLPTDLEALLKHMMQAVDPIYQEQMAGFLRFAHHATSPFPCNIYWSFEREFQNSDYAIDLPLGPPLLPAEFERRQEQVRRWVTARTNGLLEVRGTCVVFLHRTVKDFLATKGINDYLEEQGLNNRDIFLSLAKAHLTSIKMTSYDKTILRYDASSQQGTVTDDFTETCQYASQAPSIVSDELAVVLDELERCYIHLGRTSQTIMNQVSHEADWSLPFRTMVVSRNLPHYLETKLHEDPDYLSIFELSPLSLVLSQPFPSREVIQVLLQHGENPDQVWLKLVRGQLQVKLGHILETSLLSLFLEHGANPNVICEVPEPTKLSSPFLEFLMMPTRSAFQKGSDSLMLGGFMRSLDAFLHAGASLTVHSTILRTYCDLVSARVEYTHEKTHRIMHLAAQKILGHCFMIGQPLEELRVAVSEGFRSPVLTSTPTTSATGENDINALMSSCGLYQMSNKRPRTSEAPNDALPLTEANLQRHKRQCGGFGPVYDDSQRAHITI